MAIFGALAPILIPAAIGAVTSAAFGRNPLQGAVMGGVSGGLLNAAGGAGGLFDLGSGVGKSAVTNGVTSAGTAFGASQAPTALLSGAGTGATTGAISNVAGTTASPYAFGGNELVTSSTKPLTASIGSPMSQGVVDTRYMATEGMSPYTSNAGQGADLGAFDMANMTGVPAPDLSKNVAGQSDIYTGGGAEVEKPLYERAYESVINYAQKNPLEVAGLGLMASGGIRPRQPQISGGSVGSITKGTPPQNVGQPLQVRRPTRFA